MHVNRVNKQRRRQQPRSIPAKASISAAAGSLCALLAAPSGAVELGSLDVQSGLGQPLRASIAFALGPNEQLAEQCVYLRSGQPADGIPMISRASATLRGNRIVLRGDIPLREPMMGLQLVIDCPYTANLQRNFTLLLNPVGQQTEAPLATRPAADEPRPAATVAARPARSQASRSARAQNTAPVSGTRYRVLTGDTLSEIVARIEGRTLALWPAVDAVFAANPEAFSNGDMNRIIAGSTIIIPDAVTGGRSSTPTVAAVRAPEPASDATPRNQRAYGGASEGVTAVPETRAPEEYVDVLAAVRARNAAAEANASAELHVEAETAVAPVAAAPEPAAAEPAVSIPNPAPAQQQQPVVPATRSAAVPVGDLESNGSSQSWLVWLGGSGVAIFLALLMFGRRLRERFAPSPDLDDTQVNEELFNRRSSDRGENVSSNELDFADTITNANQVEVKVEEHSVPVPDFDTGDDVDVALDYSFSSSGDYSDELDVRLDDDTGFDPEAPTAEMPRPDAIEENTGYDMSMVLDVTKQDFSGMDTTSRDLHAVEVKPTIPGSRSLDLTTEFDYKILEQDYEEELTATQALNREIAEAALELQNRLSEFDDDPTAISMAEDLEGTAEVTTEMPARALSDDADSTDINEALTARLPEHDDDLEFADLDATVEHLPKKTG